MKANEQAAEGAQLMAKYLALPEKAREIVNLLAVNWGPLTVAQIKAALNVPAKFRLDNEPAEQAGLLTRTRSSSGYGNNLLICAPAAVERVARHLVAQGRFQHFAALARKAWPFGRHYIGLAKSDSDNIRFERPEQLFREVRIGLYQGDEAYIQRMHEALRRHSYSYYSSGWEIFQNPGVVYALVCSNPFDGPWFQSLPVGIRKAALPGVVQQLAMSWRLDAATYQALIEQSRELDVAAPALALAALLRGDPQTAAGLLGGQKPSSDTAAAQGVLGLLRGHDDAAIQSFEEALRLYRKETSQRKGFLPGLGGVFYILALNFRNQGKDIEQAKSLLAQAGPWSHFATVHELLRRGLLLEGDPAGAIDQHRQTLSWGLDKPEVDHWTLWIGLLILHRYDNSPKSYAPYLALLGRLRAQAENYGLDWLAAELAQLQARLDPQQSALAEAAAAFKHSTGLTLIVDRVHYLAPWERALQAIRNSAPPPAAARAAPAETGSSELRLAWLVSEDYGHFSLEAREQKRSGKSWTKGKPTTLKSLQENAVSRPYLTEQDRRVAALIVADPYHRSYKLTDRGWLALAGHPAVFWETSGAAAELVAAPPELRVRKLKNGQVRIQFWPQHSGEDRTLVITKEGLTRIKLTELRPEHHRIARIIGEGFDAPATAQAQVLEGLGAVSSLLAIHSDIGTVETAGAETVAADSCPRVQLLPEGEGLRVAVLTRPFGDKGAYFVPGKGGSGLIAEIEGRRLQTERNLREELRRVARLIVACPALEESADPDQPCQWFKEDAESSLQLLLELGQAGEDKAVIEWPQGQKFKVIGQADLGQMSVQFRQQRDWFSVSGELTLDSGEVIQMQMLLDLLGSSPGRFVRLDGDRFLALTDSFRKRLEDLKGYSEEHGQGRRVHPLALPVMEELAEGFGQLKVDQAWKQRIEQLREAERLQPKLPSTLQAELRDYQLEGYVWLARLAAWGVGACLADDMGLGKTVQAIAILLTRAADGPALVIAPTSVGFNWHNEVARFAPTLNLKSLGGDRQSVIDSLGPFDLLICSYGLLQQEAVGEMLAKVRWRTLVLDEAQAIKNAATRRSQQAMALQADFKLITTGTPVENHLGELWNLFRFINPGLLGSLESFNRRFAGPIERDQDREARQRLKRLIQPYLLRRTKSQVLSELPPRTEIELQVELGEKEAAFYEALRRKLLQELDEGTGPIEDQRFKVLAAITKLRRACCNPNLIAPELGLSSSKLDLLGDVLSELLENRHKALVFSQFVDHLTLVRAYLDQQGIAYQYLDGQTPAPERKTRVEAFQAGEGEVFLISLKAGGTGLNLTAADYVIHLDPWWNPAVEDQASDRAHRIGQNRPVTVYRLVAKGTIEEQIVSLHRHKRELADSLLEGGEMSAKFGAEDLLELMRAG
jgi:superfamily II DNA or RNA helicase